MSYFQHPSISNSDLGLLNYSPRRFKAHKDGEKGGISGPSLELGSLIHCLVLEPLEYNDRYIVVDMDPPTDLMDCFLTKYITEERDSVELYKECYKTGALKEDTIKKRVEEALTAYTSYITAKKDFPEKIVITPSTLHKANNCIMELYKNPRAFSLLCLDIPGQVSMEEQEIYWEMTIEEVVISCKAKIDKMIIDSDKETIYLVDLKTTAENVYGQITSLSSDPYKNLYTGYLKSFFKYDYLRQLAFYSMAIRNKYPDYNIVVYNPVVSTVYPQATVYEISEHWLEHGQIKVMDSLYRYAYHKKNDVWESTMEEHRNNGVIKLN